MAYMYICIYIYTYVSKYIVVYKGRKLEISTPEACSASLCTGAFNGSYDVGMHNGSVTGAFLGVVSGFPE